MPDPLDRLQQLARPRLLVGAARFGLGDWRRDRDLRRLLRRQELPSPGLALSELLDHEAVLDEARCLRAASYVIARHVEVLTAVMAEARLAQSRDPQAPETISGVDGGMVVRPPAPMPDPCGDTDTRCCGASLPPERRSAGRPA